MSYNENVGQFLESLGSFYETVPQEDLQILVGNIINDVPKPVGMDNTPFRIPVPKALLSSLEASPASSFEEKTSYSPVPMATESDSDGDEFIDTIEVISTAKYYKNQVFCVTTTNICSLDYEMVVHMRKYVCQNATVKV